MKSNISSSEKMKKEKKRQRSGISGGRPCGPKMSGSWSGVALHDFKNALKQSAVLMLLGLIVFTVLFPVSTAAAPELSIFNVDYTHQQLKFRFCAEETLPVVQAAAVVFGAALGLRLFSFLTDRSRTSFYLSLGLKRRKLFLIRFAAGLLTAAVSVLIPVAVSVVLNYAALGGYQGLLSYAAALCAGLILQAALMMLIAAAACCLAGTFSEAAVLTATLAAAPTVILFFVNVLMKAFLWGNTFGEATYSMESVAPGIIEKFSGFNPLTFFYGDMGRYYGFSREMASADPEPVHWAALLLWTAAAAAAAAVVCALFCRRKAEHAGISGLSRFHRLFVPLIWPMAAFAVVLEGLKDVNRALALAAAFLCFALFYAVIVSVTGRNARLLQKCGYAAGLMAAAGIAVAITSSGMFGYASRVPDTADIASVSISYTGQPALLTSPAGAVSSGASWYSDARVSLSEEDSIERAAAIHRQIAGSGIQSFGTGGEDFADTVIPYDLHVEYTLKSGRTVSRYYDRASLGQLAELLKLEDSGEFRRAAADVIRGNLAETLWNSEAFAAGEIYLADRWLSDVQRISLGENRRAELLEAVASDVASQSVEDRYFPESDADARLFFTLNGESDLETFGYSSSNATVWLTDSYRNTKALLAEWGAEVDGDSGGTAAGSTAGSAADIGTGDSSAAGIESITLQKYDPYASMNKLKEPASALFLSYRSDSADDFPFRQDFGTRPGLTDARQISEIAPSLRSTYFMSGGGYVAAVKTEGSDRYTYMFLPYEAAPDFINQKMS